MKIKSILAGAAVVLVAGIGSASADDAQFSILGGISATPMTQGEMAEIVGENIVIALTVGLLNPMTHSQPAQSTGGAVTAFTKVNNAGAQGFGAGGPVSVAFTC